jgi:putative ABC transport system permease protein
VSIAYAVNRALTSLIFGIVTMNPVLLAGMAFVLIATALIAAYIPARRAMRVDPIVALRYE